MAKLNVNGKVVEVQADDETPLLWVIREQLGMTGTKYGCGVAQCGACTVHVDGVAMRSCAMPLSAMTEAQKIVTIEGLSPNNDHPLQKAWVSWRRPGMVFARSPRRQLSAEQALGARNMYHKSNIRLVWRGVNSS